MVLKTYFNILKKNIIKLNYIIILYTIFQSHNITIACLSDHTELERKVFSAARRGNLEEMIQLSTEKKFELNIKDHNGNGASPLHYAVLSGNQELIEYLLKLGSKVNLPDANLSTPLHYAAAKQDVISLRTLLNNNANSVAKTGDGITCLNYGQACGNTEIISLFMKHNNALI